MPKRLDQEPDYLMLLICSAAVIVVAFTLTTGTLSSLDPHLGGIYPWTWWWIIGIALAVLTIVTFYLALGSAMAWDWMLAHFGQLWWLIFADEDYNPTANLPAPESAAGAVSRAMDHIGESVKNAIIDLGIGDEEAPSAPSLPDIKRHAFITALRPRVDEILARMADAINDAPTDGVIDVTKRRIDPLLNELGEEVLAQGLRLRDAAYAELLQERRPQGEWARKYRMMVTSGGSPLSIQNPKSQI